MRITIGKKLYGAFGLMIVLMLFIGAVSWRASMRAEDGSSRIAEMLNDVKVGGESVADIILARMRIKDFLIRNSEEDVAAYNEAKASFLEAIAKCDESFQDPGRRERLEQIKQLFAEYDATFDDVKTTILERNQTVASEMDVIGPRLIDAIKEYQYAQIDAGNNEQVKLVAPVANDIFEARLFAMKFLRTTSDVDRDRALTEIRDATEKLQAVIENEKDADVQAHLETVAQDVAAYKTALTRVTELVAQRNELVINRLDVIGPQIAALSNEVIESLEQDSGALEDEVASALTASKALTAACLGAAILVAISLGLIMTRGLTRPINLFLKHFDRIAKGDFTEKVACKSRDELGDLASGINTLIDRISTMITEVKQAANDVAAASTEIAASSEEMSQGMSEQSGQVTQISSAIEEMSASIVEVARKAADAAGTAKESGQAAEKGGEVVGETIQGMNNISDAVKASSSSVSELGRRGDEIGQIIEVINDIADQTNLLALNAAIEAARAGEHGRGFAVVADEVRKLADRTTQATEEIGKSITAIQTETGQAVERMNTGNVQAQAGVESATAAGDSLRLIVSKAQDVASMIQSIAAASEQQSSASEEISHSIQSISSVTEQAAQGAGQAAAAATQLSTKAEQLQMLTNQFKTAG